MVKCDVIYNIREESVQARTQMYDILSMLRRRGVTSGIIHFAFGRCEIMFFDGDQTIYDALWDKYECDELRNTVYSYGTYTTYMRFTDVKHKYVFRFTDKGIFTDGCDRVRHSEPFDISELLFELKFEGMK